VSLWRNHSRTIVGLLAGPAIFGIALWHWPQGGPLFDGVSMVSAVLLGLGIQGLMDRWLCETARPEEPPR
jgi:hypothetical protein